MSEDEVRVHHAALLEEGSGDGSLWHPYQAVPSQALADIEEACPQP